MRAEDVTDEMRNAFFDAYFRIGNTPSDAIAAAINAMPKAKPVLFAPDGTDFSDASEFTVECSNIPDNQWGGRHLPLYAEAPEVRE